MREWVKIVSAAVLILTLLSCGPAKDLVFTDIKNFRLSSPKLSQPIFAADVRFYNPNSFAMVLKHADVDVYINSKMVGKVVLDSTFNIPKKDTFSLPVMLDVTKQGAYSNALQLIMKKEITVKVLGTVKAGKGVLLKDLPVNYEIRRELGIF